MKYEVSFYKSTDSKFYVEIAKYRVYHILPPISSLIQLLAIRLKKLPSIIWKLFFFYQDLRSKLVIKTQLKFEKRGQMLVYEDPISLFIDLAKFRFEHKLRIPDHYFLAILEEISDVHNPI